MEDKRKVNIIAEIGINHNGNMDLAKEIIRRSKEKGCDYVKIQKRNPDVCVPEKQKNKLRKTPWGELKYIDYKKKIEFSEEEVKELKNYSESIGIKFFASVWDKDSVDLMKKYTKIGKIPSALITDKELCKYARDNFEYLIISTGMSTEKEIEECVNVCNPDVIMHSNSTYPCPVDELNFNYINHLKKKYTSKELGYSGHESGIYTSIGVVAYNITWLERHVTKDKTMYGSDQKASLEYKELGELVKGIREMEEAMKYKEQERILFKSEEKKKESLRK